MSLRYLTIALSKGRLADLSIEMLEKLGIDCSEYRNESRKLIFADEINKIKFFLVKPAEVPTYVEYGAADMGVVGKDTLLEEGRHLSIAIGLGISFTSSKRLAA